MTPQTAREYIAAAMRDTTGIGPAVLAFAGLQLTCNDCPHIEGCADQVSECPLRRVDRTMTDAEAVAIVTKARHGVALAIEQTATGISAKWEF